MDAKNRKKLLKQFVDNSPEELAKIKAEAQAVLQADPARQDALDVIEVVTELLNAPPPAGEPGYEEVVAENAQLKARIAELESAQKQVSEDEKVIREKMSVGLTREQAISVIHRQRAHDAHKAEEKAKAEEAAKAKAEKGK